MIPCFCNNREVFKRERKQNEQIKSHYKHNLYLMKKSLILRIAFLGLFLAGLGLYGNSGQLIAQSGLDGSLFDEPQVTFVSKQIASERIDNSIVLLKILLENLTHGSPEYKEIFAKYTYSVSVQNFFINGQTIPQAIV